MFSASLFDPTSVKNGTQDLFANVKVPFQSSLTSLFLPENGSIVAMHFLIGLRRMRVKGAEDIGGIGDKTTR